MYCATYFVPAFTGSGPISATRSPPFGRHPASAIVKSHTFPSAGSTVPVLSLACSAEALVENLSRCQKTECAENCPTGSLARIQQPISPLRSLTGRHPANPFCANAESLAPSDKTLQTEMASTSTKCWDLAVQFTKRFTLKVLSIVGSTSGTPPVCRIVCSTKMCGEYKRQLPIIVALCRKREWASCTQEHGGCALSIRRPEVG